MLPSAWLAVLPDAVARRVKETRDGNTARPSASNRRSATCSCLTSSALDAVGKLFHAPTLSTYSPTPTWYGVAGLPPIWLTWIRGPSGGADRGEPNIGGGQRAPQPASPAPTTTSARTADPVAILRRLMFTGLLIRPSLLARVRLVSTQSARVSRSPSRPSLTRPSDSTTSEHRRQPDLPACRSMTKGGDYAERSRTNVHLTSSQSVTVRKLSMAPGLLRWAPVEQDPGTPRPDPMPGRDGAITAWPGLARRIGRGRSRPPGGCLHADQPQRT